LLGTKIAVRGKSWSVGFKKGVRFLIGKMVEFGLGLEAMHCSQVGIICFLFFKKLKKLKKYIQVFIFNLQMIYIYIICN